MIILRDLLCKINYETNGKNEPMLPKDAFDVIVGTSTGGLIALMIVKLNLDVDQCIDQYKKLSRKIFGKPNAIGRWTVGFVRPRYSGRKVRKFVVDLIRETHGGSGEDLMMENIDGHESVYCSVLCRELENNWTRARRPEPVFLCSHMCRQPGDTYEKCRVCDAACATSAAPTYFEARKILDDKIVVDGGFGGTNNPSRAAWEHYCMKKKSWSLPQREQFIWVNIGTGSPQTQTDTIPERPLWTRLVPNFLLEIIHLASDMQRMLTEAEQVAKDMAFFASETNDDKLKYSRFSADNGLDLIALDDYKKVDDIPGSVGSIKDLTDKYLQRDEVQAKLKTTAESLADVYNRRRVSAQQSSESPSPVRGGLSPILFSTPRSPSPLLFPDDLSARDLPGLSQMALTDEFSERPRTPRPSQVPMVSDVTKSESTDVVGLGDQFPLARPPPVTILVNEGPAEDDAIRSVGEAFEVCDAFKQCFK